MSTEQATSHDMNTELKAALQARQELGPEMDDHLVEAFLARIQTQVDARVAARIAAEPKGAKPTKSSRAGERVQVEVVAGSMALAIPLMAIAGNIAHTVGVVFVVMGVVIINLLYYIDRWVRFQLD